MNKIRKGDQVIVLTGRDKGKKGEVLSIEGDRVLVAGVNSVKKHMRPNPMKNEQGGIVSKDMPIHRSNVSLMDGSGKASRVRIETTTDGRRQRVFVSTGQAVAA